MKRFRTLAAGITSLLAVSFASAQTMVVLASPLSHKVLTADSSSTAQYAPVVQADYVDAPNQHWTLLSAGGGKYRIYNNGDGRNLEATTNAENTPIYTANEKPDDVRQMWRFGPGDGAADRAITSAFNGLTATTDANSWWAENAPVIQTRSANVVNNWLVIPVNSVPNCRGVATDVNIAGTTLDVQLQRVRNALRVVVAIYPQDSSQGAPVWRETAFNGEGDSWDVSVDTASELPVTEAVYYVDGYATGADNQWHYLGSTLVVVGRRTPPGRTELTN